MYPADRQPWAGSNYWPDWDSHYAPMVKSRPQLHHRNNYAPPAYSNSFQSYSDQFTQQPGFPRTRRPLIDEAEAPLPGLIQTANSMIPSPLAKNMLMTDFESKCYNCLMPLNVRCEVKSVEATIIWDTPTFTSRAPQLFIYTLQVEGGDRPQFLELASWKTRLTIDLCPGTYYTVTVEAVTREKVAIGRGKAEFKAVFDSLELYKVYNLALSYLKPLNEHSPSGGMQQFYIFYRNKPTAYFDQVRFRDHGIMKKYRKDDNGHPASPINGEIDGLFFNARQPGGQMPKHSPFGKLRLSIPAEYLFTPEHNLYFCDFYCNNSTHYVTVVACLPDSLTDQFCKQWLMPLDPTNNVFLFARVNPYTGELEHYINSAIWVEFYYTEDVPISWGTFDTVFSTGQSKPNGVPNNKWCTVCNLYPLSVTSLSSTLIPFANSPGTVSRKRSASILEEDEDNAKKMRVNAKPVSSADFVLPPVGDESTFHLLMKEQRENSKSNGDRVECADPVIVEVICKLINDVVDSVQDSENSGNESSAPILEETTDSMATDSKIIRSGLKDITGINSKAGTALLPSPGMVQRSFSNDENQATTTTELVDKQYRIQAVALEAYRNGRTELSSLVKEAEGMLNETKKMEADLSKKVTKLK